MKTKTFFAASLLANAILLGEVGYLWMQNTQDLNSPPPILVCVPEPEPDVAATPATATALPLKRPTTADIGWVKSPDYSRYVARLRKLGCSEENLRGILMADINDLFHWRARSDLCAANHSYP